MELSTKALYNALRFRALEEGSNSKAGSSSANSWKTADFRSYSLDSLYKELGTLGQTIDKEAFLAYANECDTPEELVDILLLHPDEDEPELSDHLYLLVFELWRRFLPERPSISILCDDLDWAILAYDTGHEDASHIWEAFEAVLEVVQSNVDEGLPAQEAYLAVESNCAHDLKRFFIDFILDLLDGNAAQDAEDLFIRLKPLFEVNEWTLLIQARFAASRSQNEGVSLLRKALLAAERNSAQIAFYAEAAQALRWIEEDAFCQLVLEAAYSSIHNWDDVLTYLEILADFTSFYDLDDLEDKVKKLSDRSEELAESRLPITSNDSFMQNIQKLTQELIKVQKTRIGVDRSQSQEVNI